VYLTRVLNVLVPEVVLQSLRVVAIVGDVAKHVGVDQCHLGGLADAVDESVEADGLIGPPRSARVTS
jgi:hypothetical protein